MTVVLLDVHGVLADFATPALRWAYELGADRAITADTLRTYDIAALVHHTKRERWLSRVSARGFCAALLPYEGAKRAVSQLQRHCDVVAVTAPMPGGTTWANECTAWLRDHFGFTRDQVVHTEGKHWVGGEYFADDSASNLALWAYRWGTKRGAFLIARPYNEPGDCAYPRGPLEDFVRLVLAEVEPTTVEARL